jgi:hypothetical protein
MSERSVTALIIGIIALGVIVALLRPPSRSFPTPRSPAVPPVPVVAPEAVPLVSGDEPLAAIFIRTGCPVCHTIPGISGADGRVGPPLWLGTTGAARLVDPAYQGRAKTIREYVIESVVEPSVYVVPGYPASTMPTWYGTKLSALALEKISEYLEGLQAPAIP